MKAMVYENYGGPEVLHPAEKENPVPGENEILVKVNATSVTSGDARLRAINVPAGFRLITRLAFGLTKPRKQILGTEFSGVVEAVGKNVTRFKPGDSVFGAEGSGAYAEYLTISEEGAVVLMPEGITFEEAAVIPFGSLSSLVYLRDFGKIRKGQKILINGASGSLGSYAVQLAKHFGANVTAVCSTSNLEWVKDLGVDHVIDYTREDITRRDEAYDIIFDTVGKLKFNQCLHLLSENGRFLLAVAGIPDFFQVLWTSVTGKKKAVAGVAIFTQDDLEEIKTLIEKEVLKPVIDRTYTFEQLPEAHRYVDKGHKKANVAIRVISG